MLRLVDGVGTPAIRRLSRQARSEITSARGRAPFAATGRIGRTIEECLPVGQQPAITRARQRLDETDLLLPPRVLEHGRQRLEDRGRQHPRSAP